MKQRTANTIAIGGHETPFEICINIFEQNFAEIATRENIIIKIIIKTTCSPKTSNVLYSFDNVEGMRIITTIVRTVATKSPIMEDNGKSFAGFKNVSIPKTINKMDVK